MLHIKYKKTLSPFSDSEKQTHNVFRRFLSQEKESPPGNLIKSFSYKESTKVISSYYSLDNEKTQLSSKDYEEVIINNNKIINIKHSNKSIPFRQGVEINDFLKGFNGWQTSGVDVYDHEIGQLKEGSTKQNYFYEIEQNDYVYIDGLDDELFEVSSDVNKISFEIINKSGIIEPLAIRDTYVSFQENIPKSWDLYNTIKGTLQSGEENIKNNSSNQIKEYYNKFSPYEDLFDDYITIGNEKILLNNNVLNENPIEKYSILGNDDYYFDNIGTFAFSGLKFFEVHKNQNISVTVDHQTEYWGTPPLFDSPLSSSVFIITETTGSGRNVVVTGSYGTGHITIITGTLTGTNYPERFPFSIGYNTAPSYINPEIGYAGYFSGTNVFPNVSGLYQVPDGTKYYNIPVIFTDHNNSINDPNLGNGLTIDVIIEKSFISNVKIHNFGNNYPIGEFRYGIAANSLFSGSQESTGIGVIKIK